MENSSKQIDSCIKMFALLKLLLEDNANFNQVIKVISDGPQSTGSENSNYSVTLNKYLNTLKIFGLNVKKERGQYHLLNPLFKINLTAQELKAFLLLKRYSESEELEESMREELTKIIRAFELRFSESTQMLAKANESQHNANFNFYYKKFTDKLDTCSKFCREDYIVEIIYYDKKNKEKKINCKALDLNYRSGAVFLEVLDLTSRLTSQISLDKIISIKQSHSKTDSAKNMNRVVVFGLKGRLAKNYKLRKWEYARGIENEWLIIVNRDENEDELTKRILKYGDSCKVYGPLDYKNKIYSTFSEILKLYEPETTS